MKVTTVMLILTGVLAVAKADFSNSLAHQAKPFLDKASTDIRNALQRSHISRDLPWGLHDVFISQLQQMAEAQLNLIQQAIQAGQEVSLAVIQQLNETVAMLQSLGGSVAQTTQDILQDLLNNLTNNMIYRNQKFKEAEELIADFNLRTLFLRTLELELGNVLDPGQVKTLLNELTTTDVAIAKDTASDRGSEVSIPVGVQEKGIGELTSLLSDLMSLVWSFGGNSYVAVQSLVTNFFAVASAAGNVAVDVVADQLLSFLRPFKWALGRIYCQVVGVVEGIIGSPLLGEDC